MINDIYSFIDANTSLSGGTNLFKARLSDKPDNQVVIYATGGIEPDRYLPTADPTFQLYVRNLSYANGWDICEELVQLLHQRTNEELVVGGNYYYYIFLMNEPQHIGRDDKGRHEFSINFICKVQR